MQTTDIRRVVGDDTLSVSPAVAEALAQAKAAQAQARELQRRLDRLESDRGRGLSAPVLAPAPVDRSAAGGTPSIEDIKRALDEMPASERVHLITRMALAVPDSRRGK